MKSEHGVLVGGFCTSVASSPSVTAPVEAAAAARAALVESQHPGFYFDFIVHRGTVGAWQAPKEPGSHCLDIEQLSTAPCCVLTCRNGVDVEERPEDAVALVSTYRPLPPGEADNQLSSTEKDGSERRGDPTEFDSLDSDSEPLKTWITQIMEASAAEADKGHGGWPAHKRASLSELAELWLPADWAD